MDDTYIDPNTIDPTTVQAGTMPVETTASNSSSGSTQTVATPADRDAMAQQTAASMEAANQQRQVGDAEALRSNGIADVQGEDADLARQQATDAAADHQAYLDRIETARQQQRDAEDSFKNHQFHDYLPKQGEKIKNTLGAIFSGLSGNQAAVNALHEEMQDRVKQDFEQQRADVAQRLDLAKMKGADVNDLYTQWERELGASKVKEAKAHEAIAAKALEMGTRLGIPVDQLKNNVTVQNMIAGAQKARLESQLHFDRSNRSERTTSDSLTTPKGKTGPTAQQMQANADLADAIPDAQALIKDPLTAAEMPEVLRRLKPPKEAEGVGGKIAEKLGDWTRTDLTPEQTKRVETAVRLAQRLNPMVGERKTPESDVATALSRLPTADDADTTKADRLMQTLRSQAYRTTNPKGFANAAKPAQAAAAAPAGYSKDVLAQARAAMADPNAPAAVKLKASRILSGGN